MHPVVRDGGGPPEAVPATIFRRVCWDTVCGSRSVGLGSTSRMLRKRVEHNKDYVCLEASTLLASVW
jgi:hypothetical protein